MEICDPKTDHMFCFGTTLKSKKKVHSILNIFYQHKHLNSKAFKVHSFISQSLQPLQQKMSLYVVKCFHWILSEFIRLIEQALTFQSSSQFHISKLTIIGTTKGVFIRQMLSLEILSEFIHPIG
jgi:hypothetical protein